MYKALKHSFSKIQSAISGEFNLAVDNLIIKRKVRKLVNSNQEINLELGAGINRQIKGWYTLDMIDGMDLKWNLQYGVPFPNDTVSTIFSSHVFEHFHGRHAQYLFAECYRVLKPGGTFLITVPNARLFLETYSKTGANMLHHWDKFFQPAYWDTGSSIDIVNYMFFMAGDHRFMYDEESLLNIMKATGFQNVSLREMDPLLDSPIRVHESLYAVGTK